MKMNKNIISRIFSFKLMLLMLITVFAACVEDPKTGVKIQRFDIALTGVDTANIESEIRKLYADYPEFFPVYIAEVMEENPADTAQVAQQIKAFLRDTVFGRVNNAALKQFENVNATENALGEAFASLKVYFPETEIPEIYFFVSGFNRSKVFTENFMGIGTDLFLGADFPDYKEMTYSYLAVRMTPETIPVEILSHLLYESSPAMNDERLLENMIYHGKVLYILSELLPGYKPEQIIGYTPEQIRWCNGFEKEIWTVMVEQKHLFSSDFMLINKYINDAPFTTPVSQESPGRLGVWVGWQIVKNYMKNNRKTDLNTLLKLTDAALILENSAYMPR